MFAVLWWLLALGAVAVFALVGWRLWRAGIALLRELAEAGAAFDRFQVALDEAVARRGESAPVGAQLGDDLGALRAEVARLRAARGERRGRRRATHEETYDRWADLFR